MRIAIITEGQSEFKSLPSLYAQIQAKMPPRTRITRTLKVNFSPDAPFPQIVAACRSSLIIAATVADMAVVVLDREQQQECPGVIANRLEREFHSIASIPVRVALKDRMYENWLIADVSGLKARPKRFPIDRALERRITPGKADRVNALAEFKRIVTQGQYDKIPDSVRICRTANVEVMAQNSRSFRHLLHILNYSSYKDGCKSP